MKMLADSTGLDCRCLIGQLGSQGPQGQIGRWCLRANSCWGPRSWNCRRVPAGKRGGVKGCEKAGTGVVGKGREEDDLFKEHQL